jgi:hypothetical protein
LFKKLAGHVISEISHGRSQEQLVSEALNVRSLFEADMAGLNPVETDALKHVARFAPISAAEVTERYSAGVVQSLLDSRLAIAVGDKLDTYWDIFRDFLNTDRVPIEDGYIVRTNPSAVGRLLATLLVSGGVESVSNLAQTRKTSETVILNQSHELRLFGLVAYEANQLRLRPEIINADEPEEIIRGRVETALRRHRAFSLLVRLIERYGAQGVPIALYAQELQHAFVAVEAQSTTWNTYARAFVRWFEYAGLAIVSGTTVKLPDDNVAGHGELLGNDLSARGRASGIHISPGPVLSMLSRIANDEVNVGNLSRRELRYVNLLIAMELVAVSANGVPRALDPSQGYPSPERIRLALEKIAGVKETLAHLESDPRTSALVLGRIVNDQIGASWSDATAALVGKQIRSWARTAGLRVARG